MSLVVLSPTGYANNRPVTKDADLICIDLVDTGSTLRLLHRLSECGVQTYDYGDVEIAFL